MASPLAPSRTKVGMSMFLTFFIFQKLKIPQERHITCDATNGTINHDAVMKQPEDNAALSELALTISLDKSTEFKRAIKGISGTQTIGDSSTISSN